MPLTSHWKAETDLSSFALASLETMAAISFLLFLTNCTRDEHISYSVYYSSPQGWPTPHIHFMSIQLLPDCLHLCWWFLLGLFWYVMLSDAICCKRTSWPESYPTSHALRLHHTREVSWDYIFFLPAVLQICSFMGTTYLLRKGKLEQFSISILQEQKGKSHNVR